MEIVRLAIAKETRRRLRQIAGLTDEPIYEVVERLAVAEQTRILAKVRGTREEPEPYGQPRG